MRSKTTYIVLELEEQVNENVERRRYQLDVETTIVSSSRKEVEKGRCYCVIGSRVELPHCAVSVDFPLLRVYPRSIARMRELSVEFHSEYTETEPILQTESPDDAFIYV
ncbi:hypothetical protein PUN28_005654 [Cardiocondyla obscurior]|uniref:Uncharacterized protein n=1 Tax=Cardiocondyla obscurior TaxID=286306 RepID=A0AAW2G8G3_9HYME